MAWSLSTWTRLAGPLILRCMGKVAQIATGFKRTLRYFIYDENVWACTVSDICLQFWCFSRSMDSPFSLPRSLILHVYVSYIVLSAALSLENLTFVASAPQQSVEILALPANHCASYDFLLTNLNAPLHSAKLLARVYSDISWLTFGKKHWSRSSPDDYFRMVAWVDLLSVFAVPGVAWWCKIWRLWKVIAWWWPLSNEVSTYSKNTVNMNSSYDGRYSMTFSLDKARSVGEWQSSWLWSFWAYWWRYLRRELVERQSPWERPGVHVTVSGSQRCPGGRIQPRWTFLSLVFGAKSRHLHSCKWIKIQWRVAGRASDIRPVQSVESLSVVVIVLSLRSLFVVLHSERTTSSMASVKRLGPTTQDMSGASV